MQFEKRIIPSATLKAAQPTKRADVDNAIKDMDKKYGTTFYSWIKSEDNIGYLCTFKRHMFESNFAERPESVIYAIQWLTEEWSVPGTAELLLKLFYQWRLESDRFVFIIKGLTREWPVPKVVELVNVLLIGENATATSEFVVKFTEGWEYALVVELINYLSTSLRWSESFFKNFLTNYITLKCKSPEMERELLELVRQSFDIRLDGATAMLSSSGSLAQQAQASVEKTQTEALALFRVINEAIGTSAGKPAKRADSKFDLDM